MIEETSRDFATALQDRYLLERKLGQGGMATVYLALEVRHRRHVALKVLRPHLAESLGEGRFLREIEVTARLQHPHILPVFDSGETTGSLWYTMPYVEGMTLRDRMTRDGQLPIPFALKIAREIADALDYAHRHEVIHRDVKPENILLSEDHALLADLGIAKAVASNETRLTSMGMAIGTPAYMSPEQVAGEPADGRSDLYALACVTYEMLTGEPPHLGRTAQAIAMKRLTDAPPSARRLRAAVTEEMDAALMRALAVSAADRFPTVTAFADALGAVPGATPASTRAVPMRERSRATIVTVAVAGALACLTLAGWAIASYLRSGPESASGGPATVASPTAPPLTPPPLSDPVVTTVPPDAVADSGAASTPQSTKGTVTRPKTSATDTATQGAKESALARRRDSIQTVSKCTRLLERITIGEDLMPADSTFLRTKCGK